MHRALVTSATATALACAFIAPLPAAADNSPIDDPYVEPTQKALTKQEKQRRDTLLREGKAHVEREEWKEAADKLGAAVALRSDPDTLLWLGFAEERRGKMLAAKVFYTRAHADARRSEDARRALQALDELEKNIPRVKVNLPGGAEATAYVDEARVAIAAEGIQVDPGPRAFVITAPGRRSYRTKVVAIAGATHVIDVALPPEARPETPDRPAPEQPRSTPAGAIALTAVGGALAVAGVVILSADLFPKEAWSAQLGAGIATLTGGLGAATCGVVWLVISRRAPASAHAQGPSLLPAAAPLADGRGLWIGTRGVF